MQALVTVYCRPQKTYLLLASTNFLDWIPVATNTPADSRFDYLDTLGSADGPSAAFGGSPNKFNGLIPFPKDNRLIVVGGALYQHWTRVGRVAPRAPQEINRLILIWNWYE